jgi:UDP-glucose 4-epimerase
MTITSLVTGGAGFIGAHVVNELIALDHQVIVLDDLSGGFKENVHPKALLRVGSITDSTLVDGLFEEYSFTYVYHLAAYAAEGLSHFIRRFNYQNNLIGSVNLINASVNHNIQCFVFTSSIAVYGTNTLPLSETQHPCPEDPYGIAKLAVELDLVSAQKLFDLNYIIFRPHNVYGPLQNIGDKYRNVVGIFMNQLLSGIPVSIYGKGDQSRAFTNINDVAPYIAHSVTIKEARNEVFNIGSDDVTNVADLADNIMDAMQVQGEITHLAAREEVVHAYSDHSKFNAIFKPSKKTNLKDGLREMADWVKEHGIRSTASFNDIEVKKNLPKSWE